VTVPLFALNRIQFQPALPDQVKQAIATTRFGTYVKILVGVSAEGFARTFQNGVETLTLLSDSEAGSIYDATSDDTLPEGADRMMTLLIHADTARRYASMSADEARVNAFSALDQLFPGIAPHLTFAEVFPYPTAVAYWPLAEGRSRFDEAAQSLRVPIGRVLIGGDTTENSHSEGAVRAAQRMARQVTELLPPMRWPDSKALAGTPTSQRRPSKGAPHLTKGRPHAVHAP
jgi:monoamine oxidase